MMPTLPLLLSNAKPKRPRCHPKNAVIGGRNGRIQGPREGPVTSACYRCRSSAPRVASWLESYAFVRGDSLPSLRLPDIFSPLFVALGSRSHQPASRQCCAGIIVFR